VTMKYVLSGMIFFNGSFLMCGQCQLKFRLCGGVEKLIELLRSATDNDTKVSLLIRCEQLMI